MATPSLLLACLLVAPSPAEIPEVDRAVAEEKQSPSSARAGRQLELGVGARVVIRPEARANSTFGREAGDEQWRVRQAARLYGHAKYGPLGVVVQLQDVRDWGQGGTISDSAFTGVNQGYIEAVGDGGGAKGRVSGFVRVGRQQMRQWSGRLIAESPWLPGNRAFDSARGRLEVGRFGVETGAAITRFPSTFTVELDGANAEVRTQGDQFYWLELGHDVHPAFAIHAEAIVFREDADPARPTRDRIYVDNGLFMFGAPAKGLSYQVEGHFRVGRNRDERNRRHESWAAMANIGYTAEARAKPGIKVTYELASGTRCLDADCDFDVDRDFQSPFGANHGPRGFADLFPWTNVRDLAVRLSTEPVLEKLQLWVDYHYFQLHEPRGVWRRVPGTPVGRGFDIDNDRNTLGHEVDFLMTYWPWAPLRIRPGYTVFVPTAAGADLGGAQAQHFVYLWITADIGHTWKLGRPRRLKRAN